MPEIWNTIILKYRTYLFQKEEVCSFQFMQLLGNEFGLSAGPESVFHLEVNSFIINAEHVSEVFSMIFI